MEIFFVNFWGYAQDKFHPERKRRFDARELFQLLAFKQEKQILELTGLRLVMAMGIFDF